MVHLASSPEHILNSKVHDPGRDFSYLQKTQMTVVRSQLVLKAALKQPRVAELSIVAEKPSPLEWLTREIEVDFSMGPEILSIALAGDKPEELKTLVNAVMKAYLDEFVNQEVKKRRERLEHLKELRAQHEVILRAKQKILEQFAPKLGAGDPKNIQVWYQLKVKHLGLAKEKLFAVQTQLRKHEIDLKTQEKARERAQSGADLGDAKLEEYLEKDLIFRGFVDKVAKLEQYVADVHERVAAQRADAMLRENGTLAELERAKAALAKRRKELLPGARKELQEKAVAALDASLAQVRRQTLLAQEEEKMLTKVIQDLNGETNEVGKNSFEMVLARTETEEQDKVVRRLGSEIQALSIELMAPPRARPLDEAIATKVNAPKKRLLLAGGAGALGLGLALLAVAFWEFLARRVRSVDEVACGLGVRLVGTLPAVPARGRGVPVLLNGPVEAGWQTHFTASVDSYRTMLLHEAKAHNVRVVMVTSAVSGEGKTSLASHLTVSLARAGSNVLLVDGDLRNPTAHGFFGLSRGPGLSELLRGEIDLAAAVRPTPTGGAWIMTGGECDLRAIQCLSGDGLRALFGQLKEQFDFVVVDSSPVLSVADALLVGQHVDGVILSVLYDVSRMPAVAAAQHRLALLGIPTLGAVVIGTGEEGYNPRYHYPLPLARPFSPG
jgi:capsular exopolysaccharide synthesis family protein